MEPLAPPGTEDEPPVSGFSTATKQEKERERLLAVKAVLPSGKYGNVYEFNYINGAEHWYCNACACPVMGWVFHHETGKRHSMSLRTQNQERHAQPHEEAQEVDMHIAPGEPVPPGFEGQVEKVALIQERLDVFTVGPLVALEYLLELRDYDPSKEPNYLCVLCDKKGDPRTVLTHLASYKHILQYLQKHFPTAYRSLAPYMTKQYKRNWQSALHEIAEAIEKKFGRLRPMPVDADKYEKDTVHYLELIAKGRHFSELSGYTFEEIVNKNELTKVHDDETSKMRKRSPSPPIVANPIKKIKHVASSSSMPSSSAVGSRRRSLSSVSSISSDLSDFEAPSKERKRSPPFRNRSRSRSPYVRRPPPHHHHHHVRRDLMPWERPNYRRPNPKIPDPNAERVRKQEKLDEYKKLAKAIENDMERILKNHKKNPEKHPQYNDEWKKFWNKRYKELQAESKDVSTHDFKPEWIEAWDKRMFDLHLDEIKAKKDALRKRLGLPEEPNPISFKIQGKKKYDPSKASSSNTNPTDSSADIIIIDDRDDESKSSRRSHSPWEDEPAPTVVRRRKTSCSRERDHRKSYERERERSYDRDRSYERERTSYEREYKYPPARQRIRTTADLPWERDRRYRDECYKPPSIMRDVTREPVIPTKAAPIYVQEDEPDEDIEINVVSILRLLTALEEKLGSLGPKIIDLLGQALAMEKNEANSAEQLLDNDINCVLFETVKEKLKGLLLAGLVEPIQEKAFKNAIKSTASLIHAAGKRKKESDKLKKVDPVKVPGIGTVDKAAIAKQIANALILQGKTDVTQAELEQLINAVVGMAEASKYSKQPITTASFLDQISRASSSKKVEVVKQEEMVKKVVAVKEKSLSPPPPPLNIEVKEEKVGMNMEGLSDSDLQTLLQNFKDLSTEEQHGLINYLKTLEAREPDRVERLRKFVNLGGGAAPPKQEEKPPPTTTTTKTGRESPFSHRLAGLNPSHEGKQRDHTKKILEETKSKASTAPEEEESRPRLIDSDEDDYSFDDVVKAASKNVKQHELQKEREIVEESIKLKQNDINLDETKALINNIMSNINAGGASGSKMNADLAKTLNNIPVNMAHLANIVGNVQNMSTGAANKAPGPSGYSYGGFVPQQAQNYPNQGFYQRGGYARPNVAYPNYGAYVGGRGGNQPPYNAPPGGSMGPFGGGNYGGRGTGPNNYNNGSRW